MNKLTFHTDRAFTADYLPVDEDFEEVERLINAKLPEDYIVHMKQHNTLLNYEEADCFPVHFSPEQVKPFKCLGGISDANLDEPSIFHPNITDESQSAFSCNIIRCILNDTDVRGPILPEYTFPIGRGGGRDRIVMSVSPNNYGNIYYWVGGFADAEQGEGHYPSYNNMGFVANSFTEFLGLLHPYVEEQAE